MPDRSCHKPAKPATAPTNLTADPVKSPASPSHLGHGKRYARAAQAPSPTPQPINQPWWPGRFVKVLGLGSGLNSAECYARADQPPSLTLQPHLVLGGIEAKSARGLGGRLKSGTCYTRAGQVLCLTPHSLLLVSLRGLLPLPSEARDA